ncbi:MAG: acyltransferase domain-containing protein [Burkholderiales bacterium]|nr:acyltransferase domain-containing protein [Burkholderiales bacterium]
MTVRADIERRDSGAPGLEPIAIIGMACLFPQAPDLASFWRNIVAGVDAVTEPAAAWDAERYLQSGRIKTAFGGYLKELFRFDPREFGIMPNSLDGGEPDQFVALRIARDALADAGYLGDHDHRDTGIVLGHSTYLHRGQGAILQNTLVLDQTMELLASVCPTIAPEQLAGIRALMKSKLPPSNADIAPGLVPNVMTGRIANRLNLKGPNYLLDAACSSSLLAVNAAIDELRSGRSRMMLAGGVNASLPAEVAVIFTQLGALSGRGKVRPFSTGSDGTLLGEGLGVVVLKRLADAMADGDRIYAVVRGVGQASDGRGHGLLAPSVEGETLAIRRAYDSTGVDPASVSLVEAHGTGIPLGDKTEIAALKNVFGERRTAQGAIAIGSVKSMISHCIPAAGIAGLIKTALALHHRVLPPTLCEAVNPELGIAATPFYVNTEAGPWIARLGSVRRAGIDSFGFGGINVHAIVEEAPVPARRPERCTPWPAELVVLSAATPALLLDKLEALGQTLLRHEATPLPAIAAALARADRGEPVRLAFVAKDAKALAKAVEQARTRLRDKPAQRWSLRSGGAFYGSEPDAGKLAFLFPGEGSQYTNMLADLAMCFGEVQQWLDFWHSLYDQARGDNRTDVLFPHASENDEASRKRLDARLHDMDVGSEAVFVAGMAMHSLLRSLGVEPDVMMGHSSGESAALAASGAVPAETPLELAAFVRELNAVYEQVLGEGKIPTGALLAVGAMPAEAVQAHIAATGAAVVIAMDNCGNQLVLYGAPAAMASLQGVLSADGAICLPLPFDRGYHTADFADVSAAFHAYYGRIKLRAPRVPLYSCASAMPFPSAAAGVRKLAAAQWSQKVRFRETIEQMVADGVGCFVEVGPSGNLTAFVNDIPAGKAQIAVATNLRRRGGVEQLLTVLAQLYASGRPVRLESLFAGRRIADLDLAQPVDLRPHGVLLDNTMPVLRYSAEDREALRKLAVVAERAPPPADDGAVVVDAPAEPQFEPDAEAGAVALASATGPERDPLADVMADYFDVMRGFLEQQRAVVESWQGATVEATPSPSHGSVDLPFLHEITERGEQHLVARCHLDLAHNFLKSHVLSGPVSAPDSGLCGLACVPLMVSVEIMAEACSLLSESVALQAIENVRAFDWIALDDEALTLEVRADLHDAARQLYRATIFNGTEPVVTADFQFAPDWRLGGLAPLGAARESVWSGPELYTTGMFHGPVFQSVRRIAGWNEAGIDAELFDAGLQDFFVVGETPRLILNPVLLDAVGQVAAYWVAQQAGVDFNCFPSTIARIELYAPCPAGLAGLTMQARQSPLEAGAGEISAPRAWDFECLDAAGTPLLRVRGLVNVFFAVPHTFYEVRRDPLRGLLGQPSRARPGAGVSLWEVPHFAEDFCGQSNAIFLRILAHALLGAEERAEWRALSGTARRRREWLFGRAAVKEAVRMALFQQTGTLLFPSDITVLHDELGAPYVDGWWRGDLAEAPQVSLSHTARACLVAVAAADSPVGVDFEDLGNIRQPELMIGILTAGERATVEGLAGTALDERLLRLWCAKEAAAKYLGLGLQGRPEAFEVGFVDDTCARAEVVFEGTATHVRIVRDGAAVIAVAAGEAAAVEIH